MQHCTVFAYVLVQKPDGSYCDHNQMDFCKTKKQHSLDDYFGINTSVKYPETINHIAGEKTKPRTLPGARGFEIMRPRGEGGEGTQPALLVPQRVKQIAQENISHCCAKIASSILSKRNRLYPCLPEKTKCFSNVVKIKRNVDEY